MPLDPQDISRVRESYNALRPYLEPTSLHFYEVLFDHAPELRELFREDLKGQGMRFMTTLGLILENLEDPSSTEVDYEVLGRVHATLGIRRAHFAPMEEALIESLGKKLGGKMTPELEASWREAFREFSARLINEGEIPT